jgi:hypothetical protein
VPEYGLLVVDGSGGQPELGIHLMD